MELVREPVPYKGVWYGEIYHPIRYFMDVRVFEPRSEVCFRDLYLYPPKHMFPKFFRIHLFLTLGNK